MKALVLLVFLLGLSSSFLAQDDTLYVSQDTVKPHSVKKAVLLSIMPGLGQIYNHRAMPKGKKKAYWKVPLIYAGLGAATYFLISNQNEVNQLRREYNDKVTGNASSYSGTYDVNLIANLDDAAVLTLHDQHQTWRDFSILGVALVYGLQLLDAGVEAHFVDFDVSDDLSIGIEPTVIQGTTAGISLSFNFR